MPYTTPDEIRAALTGPVASMRTPFLRDGALDFAGLRNAVEFDIAAGSPTLLQTYGDSLHTLLTDAEVGEVTRTLVEQARGRAMVVAADRQWATPKSVEFARHVRELGADVLMVLPPDWAASCTVDTLVAHYAAVAKEIPVMAVTNIFIARGAAFGQQVMERLCAEAPGVVAVKDDFCGEFARRLAMLVRGRLAFLSGGMKMNHLDVHPYGGDGYLSSFITFAPHVAHDYWTAVRANDLPAAREIDLLDLEWHQVMVDIPVEVIPVKEGL